MVPSVLTACLLCLALLTDAATALRAYRCCAATPRRRWRAAVPRLCNEQRTLGDPATMPAIDAALRQDAVAPQLEPGRASSDSGSEARQVHVWSCHVWQG